MSIYASILTFDEHDDNPGNAPIIYYSPSRPPVLHDARGGLFDVARVVGTPVHAEMPGLRFGISTVDDVHATVVLDGFQVVRLAAALNAWISADHEDLSGERTA